MSYKKIDPTKLNSGMGFLPDQISKPEVIWEEVMQRRCVYNSFAWKAFHHMRPLLEKRYGSPFEKYELIYHTRRFISGTRYNVKIMINDKEYIHASIRHITPKACPEQLQLVYLMTNQSFSSRLDFTYAKLIVNFRDNYSIDFDEYKVSTD